MIAFKAILAFFVIFFAVKCAVVLVLQVTRTFRIHSSNKLFLCVFAVNEKCVYLANKHYYIIIIKDKKIDRMVLSINYLQ